MRELTIPLIRIAIYSSVSVPMIFSDIKKRRIPDIFSLGGLAILALFDAASSTFAHFGASLFASGLSFALFELIRNLTKGLGFGDVKLAALVGLFTGIRGLPIALFAAGLGGLIYAVISSRSFRPPKGTKIAFAPFLIVGGYIAFLAGLLDF